MKNSMIYTKNHLTSVHFSFFFVCVCVYLFICTCNSFSVCDVMFVNAVEGLLSVINYCSCKWEHSLTVM